MAMVFGDAACSAVSPWPFRPQAREPSSSATRDRRENGRLDLKGDAGKPLVQGVSVRVSGEHARTSRHPGICPHTVQDPNLSGGTARVLHVPRRGTVPPTARPARRWKSTDQACGRPWGRHLLPWPFRGLSGCLSHLRTHLRAAASTACGGRRGAAGAFYGLSATPPRAQPAPPSRQKEICPKDHSLTCK